MKFSQYNLYLETEEKYLIANTRNSNCVRLTSKGDIDHIKELLKDNTKLTLDDKTVKQLFRGTVEFFGRGLL